MMSCQHLSRDIASQAEKIGQPVDEASHGQHGKSQTIKKQSI